MLPQLVTAVANLSNCWELPQGQSAAKPFNGERSTTIPKGSTLKRVEMGDIQKDEDIV